MKNSTPLSTIEKQLLNKRGLIETVFGHLKHHYYICHSHRLTVNAMTNFVAALAAYTIELLKLSAFRELTK